MSNTAKVSPQTLPANNGADVFLNVSASTLKRWRDEGIGPRYIKIGQGKNSKVLYPITELEKFIANSLQKTF